jgi:hypothetical protein
MVKKVSSVNKDEERNANRKERCARYKQVTSGYSDTQIKVRQATSNGFYY